MSRNPIETVMGGVVLLVAGMFLAFAWSTADLQEVKGYEVSATFASIGGLQTGSDVRVNGIKVGSVTSQSLDPQTYSAVVRMSIRPEVQVPVDTVASIASEGLLGSNYVRLEPGRKAERVAPGGAIARTRDFKSLEQMVGEIIFLATGAEGQEQ